MRKGIASNTSRRKNKNKRSLSPPAQFALEDDSIISVSEGILSTPQRGDGRPETSPSRPRASSFQQDQQYAIPYVSPSNGAALGQGQEAPLLARGLEAGHRSLQPVRPFGDGAVQGFSEQKYGPTAKGQEHGPKQKPTEESEKRGIRSR